VRRQTLSGASGNGKLREWREICEDVLRETSKERLYDLLEELLEALENRSGEEEGSRGTRRMWVRLGI
jgi:hypothetical protein